MSSAWNYNGTFSNFGGVVQFQLLFDVDNTTNVVNTVTGTITYNAPTGFITTSNVSIVLPGGYLNNNNDIISYTAPYFDDQGIAFFDGTNNITYAIKNNLSNEDFVYNSINNTYSDYNTGTESLSLACLLSGTKILTTVGEINVENLTSDHVISSEGKEYKIKNILKTSLNFDTIGQKDLPFVLPEGFLGCNQNLHLSRGHAIKTEGGYKLPETLGLEQLTVEKMRELNLLADYYNVELECSEGETRRTNTLTANGVLVESYSPNEILC